MAHLLVVDDEQSICWGLSQLAQELGYSVDTAASAEEGFEQVEKRRPDAIVLDIRLPGIDGLSAMGRFRELAGPVPIIVITAYGELSTAVDAVRHGAFDYLTKPFDLKVAQHAIQRAIRLPKESSEDRPSLFDDDIPATDRLVGRSAAMQEVFKRIALVAASDACVHLHGESGSGKEVAARAIHRYSARADGPFVAVNVASLSPTLAESELFGHVRGAFTGADEPRRGLLEQADCGTIFLDEVADIPLAVQVKLLRALEHGEVVPVGSNQSITTNFRIISATHRDLNEQVAAGSFRHDLYFRLVTFEIDLPPLRERRDDIPELAEYFLDMLVSRSGKLRPTIAPETIEVLKSRPFYGNVRELRNAIEHAMILARGATLLPEHLPAPVPRSQGDGGDLDGAIVALVRRWAETQLSHAGGAGDLHEQLLKLVEPPLLEAAMRRYQNQCAAAARHLGVHRTTLRKRLDQLGLGEE